MICNYAYVEAVLAAHYRVRDDRRSAFGYRLKHLQKLGFPRGTNTGRGRAALYEGHHLFLLGIAVELNQLGLLPERTVRILEAEFHTVVSAAAVASADLVDFGGLKHPTFIYFDPAVMSDLTESEGHGMDRAEATFHSGRIGEASDTLGDWFRNGARRAAYVNVSALVQGLAEIVNKKEEAEGPEFEEALVRWAESYLAEPGQ